MRSNVRPELPVEWIPLTAIKPDPQNPRRHSDRQVKQIAQSIKTFGFIVPILIDHTGTVLAGGGRAAAAELIGCVEVPVIRITHLTVAQARAFRIADNRLAECSSWNDQLLGEVLRDLSMQTVDFSLEVTGFSMGEIDLRIEGLSTNINDSADPDDQVPRIINQTPVTRPGDLWQLGKHRLLCGNALESASYNVLMRRELANVVCTDPPYNVPIQGHVSRRSHHREFVMGSGEMGGHEFLGFMVGVLSLLKLHSQPSSIHFIFMDWRHAHDLLIAGSGVYQELKNICAWVKDNGGMGSLYRSQHELVFVFKNGSTRHRNNVQLGRFGRNRTNVWQYPCANTFSRQSEEGDLAAVHPTVKPVRLVADAILDCSARGEIVLDPFLGSGTTLIAAERVGRICYGMELDPLYVDTTVRRWQSLTGDSAVHSVAGKRFDDIAAAAEAQHA